MSGFISVIAIMATVLVSDISAMDCTFDGVIVTNTKVCPRIGIDSSEEAYCCWRGRGSDMECCGVFSFIWDWCLFFLPLVLCILIMVSACLCCCWLNHKICGRRHQGIVYSVPA